MIKQIILLALTLFTLTAQANWVVIKGESEIIDGNITQAREQAIEQAITYATLNMGVEFTKKQTVSNGQLVNSNTSITQYVQSEQIELISEQIRQNTLYVKLRVELQSVQDKVQTCQSGKMKAAILVPQSQIKDRTQLRYGNIGFFEKHLSQRIGDALIQHSKTTFPRIHTDERLDLKQALIDIRGYRLPTWLSEITDTQYVLLPQIIDISTEPAESNLFGLWHSDPARQFQLHLSIFHGISGEQIWSEQYNMVAPWEFEKQQTVPSNSQQFWSSTYGKNIDKLLVEAIKDIDKSLSCRPVLGQVVAKQRDRVILNLGRRNGVRVGDVFELVLQENLPDRLNKVRAVAGPTPVSITIDQTTEETSTAKLEGPSTAYNIQVNDIAIKK